MHLRSNKRVFDITKLSLEKFARSLGLEVTPKIKYLKQAREEKEKEKAKEGKEREGEGERMIENECVMVMTWDCVYVCV